jgi:hypothetical protein
MQTWLADTIRGFEQKFHQNIAQGDLYETRYWLNRIRPYIYLVRGNPLAKTEFCSIVARLESELEKAEIQPKISTVRGVKNGSSTGRE